MRADVCRLSCFCARLCRFYKAQRLKEHELNELTRIMTELKFDHDIYGDMVKAVTETREKMLNAASEHYGIPKEEIERQVEQIDAEVRKEHPEAFII